ncbi:hypothetical protein MMC27_008285 [Xylographa pallens]|nr:hypothetical protein [Xylographa pallens]
MSRRRSFGGSSRPPGSHRTPNDFRKLWRIAFLICRVISRFRAVNRYKERVINEASYDGSVPTQLSASEQCSSRSSIVQEILDAINMKEVDHALGPSAVFDVASMQEVIPGRRRDFIQEGGNSAARCLHVLDEDAAAADEPSGNTVTHETTSASRGFWNGSPARAHESPLLADYHLTSQHTIHPPNSDNRLETLWSVDPTPELVQNAAAPLLKLFDHVGPQLEQIGLLTKSSEGMAQDSENLSPFQANSHKLNLQSTMEPTAEREVRQCLSCQKTFHGTYSKSTLARHRKELHTVRERYECPIPGCLVTVTRDRNLKAHLERRHGKDWAKYGRVDQSAA